MSLFGSSGVRGVINKEFTPELATMIGMAVGSKVKSAAIGMDTRMAGPLTEAAVASGLMAAGCDTFHAGIVTTPTLAEASRTLGCGVMVTASHNPPEYEGIKLWNPDGSGFSVEQTKSVEADLESKKFNLQPWDKVGKRHPLHHAVERHVSRILGGVGEAKLKVVVDCANGPASNITPLVLQKMGCRVVTLNSNLDGHFPGRPPEPTEENLGGLKKAVVSMKADLGIAHDGDADRMVSVDEKGQFFGGDQLLALFAKRFGKKKVVATVDASMVIDDYVDAEVIRTRVGDVFVSEEVKKSKADFGGEPSGTWIFPDQTYCPDGVLAAARLAEIVSQEKLSELRNSIPCYPIMRGSEQFDPRNREKILRGIEKELEGIPCDSMMTLDGYRLQFKEGWALVRPSGTEPRIRFLAEARSDAIAADIMKIITKAVKECVK